MSYERKLMEDCVRMAMGLGAEYAEMRMEPESVGESISVEDERPVQVSSGSNSSMGILVYKNGSAGFWGSSRLDKKNSVDMVKRAVESAEANGNFGSVRPVLPDARV
ncbi:MAG: hypothetical protein HYW88_00430, partial [Candidatus Sungbacteria bacterium]|nr:hypothetical protein [Candidatus Sungbacteria bacterium]